MAVPTMPRDHAPRAQTGDAGSNAEDRPLHARPVPKPGRAAGKARGHLPARELPQRTLALELRYYIDLRFKTPTIARDRVRYLLRNHPHGAASRHVAHNLGKRRMDWLRKEGLVDG